MELEMEVEMKVEMKEGMGTVTEAGTGTDTETGAERHNGVVNCTLNIIQLCLLQVDCNFK